MARNISINRQQLLLEFISVVFAVLLALLLNSWRETAARSSMSKEVLAKISEEIKNNDREVRKALEYHNALLMELSNRTHVSRKLPLSDLPVNVYDNNALAGFIETALLFEAYQIAEVSILQNEDRRILRIADHVYRIEIEQDTLYLYGRDNIQLRTPGIRASSWQIAQATGVLVDMDTELVSLLATLNTVQGQFNSAAEKALYMLYEGRMEGITSVLQDIRYYENTMVSLHDEILELLR